MDITRLYHQNAQVFTEQPEIVENEELFSGVNTHELDRESANLLPRMGGGQAFRKIGGDPSTPMGDPKETVSWMQGANIGFRDGSIAYTGITALQDEGLRENDEWNPDYNALTWAKDNAKVDPETSKGVQDILELGPDNLIAAPHLERLAQSNSPEHTKAVVARFKQQQEMLKNMDEASFNSYALGMAAGIGSDILLTIMVYKGLGLGASAGRAAQITKTITGARLAAGARLGTAAGVEGALHTSLQMVSQDHLTINDAMLASGISGITGGLIGGALPNKLMGIKSIEGMQAYADAIASAERAARSSTKSVGAGMVEDFQDIADAGTDAIEAPDLPHAGVLFGKVIAGGSNVVDKIPYIRGWRSPKSLARSVFLHAQKLREAGTPSRGLNFFAGILNKTYDQAIQFADDFKGHAPGRHDTLVGDMKLFEHKANTMELRTKVNYDKFMKEVYPDFGSRQVARASTLRNEFGNTANNTGPLNEREFVWLSDLYAQAGHEATPEAVEAILKRLEGRVPAEAMEKAKAHLEQTGKMWDDFYLELGHLEVKLGTISAKELRPGYRPQMWDGEKILGDIDAFEVQLMTHLGSVPDEAFMVATAPRTMVPGTDSYGKPIDVEGPSILKMDEDGNLEETWAEFSAREPEIARDMRAEWEVHRRENAVERLEELRQAAEGEARSLGFKNAQAAVERHNEVMDKMIVQRTKLADQLTKTFARGGDTAPPGTMGDIFHEAHMQAKRHKLSSALDRIEAAMHVQQTLYGDLRRALDAARAGRTAADGVQVSLDDILKAKPTRASKNVGLDRDAKAALLKAERKITKLDRKLTKAIARETQARLRTETREMIDAMVGRRSPGNFESDKLIQSSRHMQRRTIDLSGVRHLDDWQKFMVNDPILIAHRYIGSMGRQMALRKHFVPFLKSKELIPEDVDMKTVDIVGALKSHMHEEFAADRKLAKENLATGKWTQKKTDKYLKKLHKQETQSEELFERTYGEFTRSDYTSGMADKGKVKWDRGAHIMQSATASSGLGWIMASNIQDIAMSAQAGGKFMTGLRGLIPVALQTLLRQPRVFHKLMEIDADLAFLEAGANVRSMSMANSRMDIEPGQAQWDFPGSMYRRIARVTQNVAVLQGWANLMHLWNRILRESFGRDFMDQIGKDMTKWDDLPDRMKAFYRKLKIGDDEAREMGRLMNLHSIKVRGSLRVPDFAKWNNPKLERKYREAILQAGHEAMQDPNIGDRPFMRRSIMGRIILQFSSFIYTAGNNFLAPMIQTAMINPMDSARLLGTVSLAMALSGVGDVMRAGRADGLEGMEEHMNKLFNPEEWDPKAWRRAYMRSPFIMGMTATAAEAITTPFGPAINEAVGFEAIDTQYNRLVMSRGPLGFVGGAAGGNITGLYQGLQDAAEGDTEAMKKLASYRMPILNTMPAWVLLSIIKDLGD